jgi:hypothetical protein
MSNTSAVAAQQEAAREEEQRKLRDRLISTLDTLPRGPSDRDTLAEKAMVAYLLTYASKDYDVVAKYAYKMADAMIAERLKHPAQKS